MLMEKKQVMDFLPHRDPFLFIDTVKEIILPEEIRNKTGPFSAQQMVGGKTICAFKVENSLKILEGHFPGDPILPGVVQVEMMAQAASFLAIHCKPHVNSKIEVALLGIDSAKFRKPVIPPMDLEVHATLTKVRGPIQMYDCAIYSNGDLISQTSVMASLKFNNNN